MKKQLVAREQEITAVQARMQASYHEHMKEVQQLQGKVGASDPRGWVQQLGRGGRGLQDPRGWVQPLVRSRGLQDPKGWVQLPMGVGAAGSQGMGAAVGGGRRRELQDLHWH